MSNEIINTYTGYMGNTFYAGPNGESFALKHDPLSNRAALDADIALGTSSPIKLGDYVIVSYGQPGSSEYRANREIDISAGYTDSYNATLWQKQYTKNSLGEYEVSYGNEPIVFFPAATPVIAFRASSVNPSADPSVALDPSSSSAEYPVYVLSVQKPWDLSISASVNLSADQPINIQNLPDSSTTKNWQINVPKPYAFSASVVLDNTKDALSSPTVSVGSLSSDGQTLPLEFAFAPAWQFASEATVHSVPAASTPEASVVTSSDNKTKIFAFGLPQAWDIAESVNVSTIDAASNPSASISQIDNNTKQLNLNLPAAWNIAESVNVSTIAAGDNPTANVSQLDSNTKQLNLSLPQAWDIASAVNVNRIAAGGTPSASVTTSEDNTTKILNVDVLEPWDISISASVNLPADQPASLTSLPDSSDTKNWELSFPKAYKFSAIGRIDSSTKFPTSPPTVSVGSLASDGQTLTLDFAFAPPWQFAASASAISAGANPTATVNTSSDQRTAIIQLSLPNAWNFASSVSVSAIAAGSTPTASIATSTDLQNKILHLALPSPWEFAQSVDVSRIDAGSTPTASITTSSDNATKLLHLDIPGPWGLSASVTLVGPTESAAAAGSYIDTSTYQLQLSIPRGARWFSGAVNPSSVAGAKAGDYYLNTSSGDVFSYNGNMWIKSIGLMGESIEIYDRIDTIIRASDIYGKRLSDNAEVTVVTTAGQTNEQKIQAMLLAMYNNTAPLPANQVVHLNVEYQVEGYSETYFTYCLNNAWQLMLLSGGVSGLFLSAIDESSTANTKGYSVNALNEALSWGDFSDLEDMPQGE